MTAPPTPLPPLPRRPHSRPRNLINAGNTCYISALLTALFADLDSFDALLQPPVTALHEPLIAIIRHLRAGTQAPRNAVAHLRESLVSGGWHCGKAQHDVSELFGYMFDVLKAPYIPLLQTLHHSAHPSPSDNAAFTERVLFLDIVPGTLPDLLHAYCTKSTISGLKRGERGVEATVSRSLIPSYTPVRETGERSSARRSSFDVLMLPLALRRFNWQGKKNRTRIPLATAINASRYINSSVRNIPYNLILRSVICHLGSSISHGHYVNYTYTTAMGWRRWDDLSGSSVPSCKGDTETGAPENRKWREELERDSYMLFYELVPGDGEISHSGRIHQDELFARKKQEEEDCVAALREQIVLDGRLISDGEFRQLIQDGMQASSEDEVWHDTNDVYKR